MSFETKKRDGFSSTLAALMVSLGSAVGLGNIWKFPYMTGTGGGGLGRFKRRGLTSAVLQSDSLTD